MRYHKADSETMPFPGKNNIPWLEDNPLICSQYPLVTEYVVGIILQG
jgi:hypothetical protein